MNSYTSDIIAAAVEKAAAKAAVELPEDALACIRSARSNEAARKAAFEAAGNSADLVHSSASLTVLDMILANLEEAKNTGLPMCQDTGLFVIFIDVGRDAPTALDVIEKGVLKGLEQAVVAARYRRSVIEDPVYERCNTKNNLPPVIHWNVVDGDDITVSVLLKGFGSENCSHLKMANPTAGEAAVIDAVVEAVTKAGAKPCPPTFIGVGIGGSMEKAALLSKRALLREAGSAHPDTRYAALERKVLEAVQKTAIGPGGLGGATTAFSVAIETAPTHIAGLPIAITINCWADRKATVVFSGGAV